MNAQNAGLKLCARSIRVRSTSKIVIVIAEAYGERFIAFDGRTTAAGRAFYAVADSRAAVARE